MRIILKTKKAIYIDVVTSGYKVVIEESIPGKKRLSVSMKKDFEIEEKTEKMGSLWSIAKIVNGKYDSVFETDDEIECRKKLNKIQTVIENSNNDEQIFIDISENE